MLRTIDLRGRDLSRAELLRLVPRAAVDTTAAVERVRPIVDAVRDSGVHALREQARDFDGVEGHALRVPAERIEASLATCPGEVRAALRHSARAYGHRFRSGPHESIVPGRSTPIALTDPPDPLDPLSRPLGAFSREEM